LIEASHFYVSADTLRLNEKVYPGDYLLSEDGNFNLTMGESGMIQLIYLPLDKIIKRFTNQRKY